MASNSSVCKNGETSVGQCLLNLSFDIAIDRLITITEIDNNKEGAQPGNAAKSKVVASRRGKGRHGAHDSKALQARRNSSDNLKGMITNVNITSDR